MLPAVVSGRWESAARVSAAFCRQKAAVGAGYEAGYEAELREPGL